VSDCPASAGLFHGHAIRGPREGSRSRKSTDSGEPCNDARVDRVFAMTCGEKSRSMKFLILLNFGTAGGIAAALIHDFRCFFIDYWLAVSAMGILGTH
jgi:hypothetical protein